MTDCLGSRRPFAFVRDDLFSHLERERETDGSRKQYGVIFFQGFQSDLGHGPTVMGVWHFLAAAATTAGASELLATHAPECGWMNWQGLGWFVTVFVSDPEGH